MKLNWGTSIVLVIIGFMTFILYFVIKGYYVQQVNLVTDDYYNQGLKHDEMNEWKQNAILLSSDLIIEVIDQDLVISFPTELNTDSTEGTVLLYRPNDSKFDIVVPIVLDDNSKMTIQSDGLLKGNYVVKVTSSYQENLYYWEKNINY